MLSLFSTFSHQKVNSNITSEVSSFWNFDSSFSNSIYFKGFCFTFIYTYTQCGSFYHVDPDVGLHVLRLGSSAFT